MTPTNHGQMTPQQLLRVATEQHAAAVAAKENSPKKEQALAALAKATAALVQTQKWSRADPRAARSTIHDEAEKQQALAALRAASAALVAPGVPPPALTPDSAAAAASPEFSCVSLVATATDAWCLATCGSSKGLSCPLAMCKCDGGEVLAETKLIDPTKMDGEMPVTEQPAVTNGISELPLVTKGAPAKITCVSLVPNANDEWCQTVCGSGGRCPGNVCRCSHDGVPYDAGEQQQAAPTHGKAPLERSASTPPVTHNGKPLPPADGPPLTHSPKLQHIGKGPQPGGSTPKYAPAYDFKHRKDAIALEASEALKMHTQYQSAYDALLTGSDGADPLAAATAATAPPHAASAPAESMLLSSDGVAPSAEDARDAGDAGRSMWKSAFADAASLLQTRAPNPYAVLPSLLPAAAASKASEWSGHGHGSKTVAPTLKGALDNKGSATYLASYGEDALSALKAREVQLVSANAAIPAADDAWARSRLDNKASADTAFLAKMQAEVSARAATKAEEDAKGAALAERSAEMRASEKMSDDAKQVAAMFTLTKTRADAKTKSDEMAVAANSVIRESRFGSKTSDDAASAAEAEKLVNAKAVAMVVADAKAEAEAQTIRLNREHTKSAADATAAANSIMNRDQLVPQAHAAAKHNNFA